jgi:hypothetical protein
MKRGKRQIAAQEIKYEQELENRIAQSNQCWPCAPLLPLCSSSSLSSIKPSSNSRLRRLVESPDIPRRCSKASRRTESIVIPVMSSPSSSSMLILSWSSRCVPRLHEDGRKRRMAVSAMRSRSDSVWAEIACRGRYWE